MNCDRYKLGRTEYLNLRILAQRSGFRVGLPIRVIDERDGSSRVFVSSKHAESETGIHHNTLRNAVMTGTRARGYRVEPIFDDPVRPTKRHYRIVECIETGQRFMSMAEVIRRWARPVGRKEYNRAWMRLSRAIRNHTPIYDRIRFEFVTPHSAARNQVVTSAA